MSDGARIIDVTFIDADTNKTFLALKLPARQLPETFATATTLNLGKEDWQVIEAKPATSAEFIASGALTLRMRKLQVIDPREILFSLPTVADEIPKPVPAKGPALFSLHEDDWLQLELVPVEVAAAAAPDLLAIAKVLSTERQGPGFKRLHIRKALPSPYAARVLELAVLERRYGPAQSIAWSGHEGAIDGGFGFRLPLGGILYGQAVGARVTGLGLDRPEAQVTALQVEEKLVRVDWCRAEVEKSPPTP